MGQTSRPTADAEPLALRWTGDSVSLLDQTRLPVAEVYRQITTWEEMERAIRELAVRGAPALGIAGAFGLYLAVRRSGAEGAAFEAELAAAAQRVVRARPTAVNLRWAVERAVAAVSQAGSTEEAKGRLLAEALAIQAGDRERNERLAQHGQVLVPATARVVTYCHTGGIATGGYGTALGILRTAHAAGKAIHVFVPETRPLLQGARLTAWELGRLGIPATLVTDNAAGYLMQRGEADLVLVGADRITRRGDVANKIGTYGLAVLARHHGLPFYVAATGSTIDWRLEVGSDIPIELREGDEVRRIGGLEVAPADIPALAPAFDVTPADLVTAIVTEVGVHRAPYAESLARVRVGQDPASLVGAATSQGSS